MSREKMTKPPEAVSDGNKIDAALKEHKISVLESQVNKLDQEVEQTRGDLHKSHEQISHLQNSLSSKAQEIADLKSTTTAAAAEIKSLSESIGIQSQKNEQLRSQIEELLANRDEQQRNTERLEGLSAESEREIARLHRAATEIFNSRNALYNSTSWKVTTPLRYAGEKGKVVLRTLKRESIKVVHPLYKQLPISIEQRIAIRNFLFGTFPWLFRGVPAYESWLLQTSRLPSDGDIISAEANPAINLGWMLPTGTVADDGDMSVTVDVIVPVYKGLYQTRRCITSVLSSAIKTPHRLIVINDSSPEQEVTDYLRSLPVSDKLILIENESNLGFTETVNKGMSLSDSNDVVLLNSDTEVANNWLDKLVRQAHADNRAGTVTPFSNNATICSYPTNSGWQNLPEGETVAFLDAAFESANHGRSIEVPTGVGFCMYIRRDCLQDVGLFDVETYGKGYGEENDFCQRAIARNWKNLLAGDTFVFHEGEVSFQTESNPRKEAAMATLRRLYPWYERDVALHVEKNEVLPLRVAATAARFRNASQPVVLHLVHALGGGTEKHVRDLCAAHQGLAKLLILSPFLDESGHVKSMRLRSTDPMDVLDLHLPRADFNFLVSFVRSFGVSLVHIHHVIGYPIDVRQFVRELNVPFYFTVHDYFTICPRINLMPAGQDFCEEPQPDQCNSCIASDHPQNASDIIWWRESNSWLLREATLVICPTEDVAARCRRYVPQANFHVANHEIIDADYPVDAPALNTTEPLRIALLGVLARHKGLTLVSDMVSLIEKNSLPLQIRLIGYAEGELMSGSSGVFSQTGHYKDEDLPRLIEEFNPHLVFFPARWPETYSYTLSAALKAGRPVMVPDIGAFPERVVSRNWSWIYRWNTSAQALTQQLCDIRTNAFVANKPPLPAPTEVIVSAQGESFYAAEYFRPIPASGDAHGSTTDLRIPGKRVVLVLLEKHGDNPSPCAYIRLMMPLIHARTDQIDIRFTSDPNDAALYIADILVFQRTAILDRNLLLKTQKHCEANGIRIIYDLDDFLIELPDTHPEQAIYKPKSETVERCIKLADEVWVSTDTLKKNILSFNDNIHVMPNYLDSTLWPNGSGHQAVRSKAPGEKIRILYMGTNTHYPDFELILPALKKLKAEFSSLIEISLIGITASSQDQGLYKVIDVPHGIGGNFPAFVDWLRSLPAFDIGIAPLIDNKFNRCKSEIKFFDYSALGLVTIASDIGVYTPIRNGDNGFLVPNTVDAWHRTLTDLVTKPELLARTRAAARADAYQHFGFATVRSSQSTRLLHTEN